MVGVPGAFTPTCSGTHVPGYLAKQAALKAKGVSEVIVCSVNDGAVMEGWAKDQKVEGSMITFLGDTRMELTKALDLVLDAEKPMEVLGNPRCKRFAMVVDNGIIKASRKISEGLLSMPMVLAYLRGSIVRSFGLGWQCVKSCKAAEQRT